MTHANFSIGAVLIVGIVDFAGGQDCRSDLPGVGVRQTGSSSAILISANRILSGATR
jgi:hypothetical protein